MTLWRAGTFSRYREFQLVHLGIIPGHPGGYGLIRTLDGDMNMMAGKGLAKLIEECGELMQIAGKKLAYYMTDQHPDCKGSLKERLEDEIADVVAACFLVGELHELDAERMERRVNDKLTLFRKWHRDPDNNEHGIDASEGRRG